MAFGVLAVRVNKNGGVQGGRGANVAGVQFLKVAWRDKTAGASGLL